MRSSFTMLLIALSVGFGCNQQTDVTAADEDGDGFAANEDCDDTRPEVHPGALEVCDGLDNDCDDEVDEAGATGEEVFYPDLDGDGFGNPADPATACVSPPGYVVLAGDCDDDSLEVYPGAVEHCDGVDEDCDGRLDERGAVDAPAWYRDIDGDGYGDASRPFHMCLCPDGYVEVAGDCDDLDANIHPEADELCDEVDNDCDNASDEDDAIDARDWYADEDGDGYGVLPVLAHTCVAPPDLVDNARDCADDDPDRHPGVPELDCADPVDHNCDGSVGYQDNDSDGYAACEDCDDAASLTHPGAVEVCDRADNDCDGEVDEGPPPTARYWYQDSDGDGAGIVEVSVLACDPPEGFVAGVGDCDDEDAEVHPGDFDICDGLDNDCDGAVDQDNAALLYLCDNPPHDAEARCFRAQCVMVCLGGWEDLDGDLQDPLGNGCEAQYAGPVFTDVTSEAGVSYLQWDRFAPDACGMEPCGIEYFMGGAAAADYDGDGWTDLFVTRVHDTDILFRNRGDGTFEDVSQQVGLTLKLHSSGAAWGDIDNDGDLDLYVTVVGEEQFFLFVNEGGTFTEEAVARNAHMPPAVPHSGFSVTFGDYDRDGWLDIHANEWLYYPPSPPGTANTRLLRNLGAAGPGHFEDVTVSAGVAVDHVAPRGVWSFTSAFVDFDRDGWPDLAMSADYGYSRLFWNNGDGTFTDGTVAAAVGTDKNGMGTGIGDYDGDGLEDWIVSAIYHFEGDCIGCPWETMDGNRLYRNNGDRTFSDRTDEAGIRNGFWAFGNALFDYDNDGDLDLVQVNGYNITPVYFERDRMRLWRNEGGLFADSAEAVGLSQDRESGKAVVVWDYDGDGDLDLFVVNNEAEPRLYRNDGGNAKDWLRVKLVGQERNLQGIGARITVRATPFGPRMVREIRAGGQYCAQHEIEAHFGLGEGRGTVAEVRVLWPETGEEQVLTNVPRNRLLVIEQPE